MASLEIYPLVAEVDVHWKY